MDSKDKPGKKDEEPANEENKANTSVELITAVNQNDAGPSGVVPLPGAIPEIKTNFQSKPGLSKSEHNLRHIITSKDVANALKSLNINSTNQIIKTNLNELKIPILNKDDKEESEPTTFVDLKKFMASCFKINKETHSGIILGDIQNVQAAPVITSDVLPEIPNTSAIRSDKTNEVVVTNSAGIQEKVSKVSSEKKKTSGNLSERSDLGLAQRDSLSSIGSNVCRICMTRGRERFGSINNLVVYL